MDKRIQVGIAVALIALLLFVTVPMFDTDQTESMEDSSTDSQMGGTASAWSKVVDSYDNTVWSSQDDRFSLPQTVIDPTSGQDAVNFIMGVRYDATGVNIDWSTMKVSASWECQEYQSSTGAKSLDIEWNAKLLTGQKSGDLVSTKIALDPLVPEQITMTYWDMVDGYKRYLGSQIYQQRTAESHPFSLTFYGHYYVEVYDTNGQLYEQYYRQKVVLNLQWVGSEFGIEWSDSEDEVPDPVGSNPSLNALADFVAFQGDVKTMTWTWSDVDSDIQRYTISVDGIVMTTGALSGTSGVIDFSHKFAILGEHSVSITIEDLQGSTANDAILVMVHSGADPIEPRDDDPIDPIIVDPLDPTSDVGADQNFDRDVDPDAPTLSLFGGTGNIQVIILIAIAGGAGWLLYNRKKR